MVKPLDSIHVRRLLARIHFDNQEKLRRFTQLLEDLARADIGNVDQKAYRRILGLSLPLHQRPLEDLHLSIRALNVLRGTPGSEIETIGELANKTERELRRIPGFGVKCLWEVRSALLEHDLKLKDDP